MRATLTLWVVLTALFGATLTLAGWLNPLDGITLGIACLVFVEAANGDALAGGQRD
ncbi:hypothetical protein [Halopiger djelfimassiliensis]|uniref:hypothetical protein n=1 Tax=Halopiger djelfimassiliensis TaxID=1293047 RepID=UPI0012B66971|nr:hypothetical protein [Halopiger djelfimassiliensis]